MSRPTSSPTTVAILASDTLAEGILARLLQEEGYATRLLGAYPTGLMDNLLDGVDVLLLTPSLSPDVRRAFLEALRNSPKTAAIPVLSLSAALKLALLDELAASVPWRRLLKELVHEIEFALGRAAASTGALLVEEDEEAV